jgi:hypothetical protein
MPNPAVENKPLLMDVSALSRRRRIIQIAVSPLHRVDANGRTVNKPPQVVALCDDGAVFRLNTDDDWVMLPPIPQDPQ